MSGNPSLHPRANLFFLRFEKSIYLRHDQVTLLVFFGFCLIVLFRILSLSVCESVSDSELWVTVGDCGSVSESE